MKLKNKIAWSFILLLLSLRVFAFQGFVVEDIKVEGLRRISAGTVFNYLPVQVGDFFDSTDSAGAMKSLYKTGFFHDVELKKEGNVLIVRVVERPSIAEIIIEGNDLLEKDPLLDGLKNIGLAEGRVYNRSLLDKVNQELFRQYYSQGYYGVSVTPTVSPLERNRVSIRVTIVEGNSAQIKDINITGNKAFTEDFLLKKFKLSIPAAYYFWSDSDQYAKEKFSADIETLRTYYLDKGYLNFKITSTQVSISPNKESIYLTINLSEGEQYKISKIDVVGDYVISKDELIKLSSVVAGDMFSQKEVLKTKQKFTERLGEGGYAFSTINVVPEIDEIAKSVAVTFYIDPGKKAYVRRIVFIGNDKTKDQVLRREMRQFEGGWFSAKKVKRSRLRLQRLGYFETVDITTPPVPGTLDQIDIIVKVVERASGSIELTAGYGGDQGFSLGASLSQQNFLGTGNKFGFKINNSKTNTIYSMNFNNPYFTPEGISRGYNFFFRQTDTADTAISSYSTDDWGGAISFGFPISEEERISVGIGYDRLKLKTITSTPQRILDFVNDNGDEYAAYRLTAGWSSDTRNQYYFPTSGSLHSASLELTFPGSDLTYYKMNYRYRWLYPLAEKITFSYDGSLGFGDGFDKSEKLPFFQNYYAGGISTVRGYKSSSLGPRDPYDADNPIGGNARILSSLELIFHLPFVETDSARIVTFIDAGNVFDTVEESVDIGDIRATAGVAIQWLSPLGSMVFSYGYPLNDRDGDDVKGFQFTMGSSF